jgi:hypothetical protein
MSDILTAPVLSSVESSIYGQIDQDGGFVLPAFWDSAMAIYGRKGRDSEWAYITDTVEWLMRTMMREPLLFVADRVLRALVCEGEHRVVPAVPEEPQNKRGQEYRKWKRSQRAHEFTENWVNSLQRPMKGVCWNLMEAVPFGHKLCEVEVGAGGDGMVPVDIAPKPRTSYRLKVDKSNRILGAVPNGVGNELLPPANILILSIGGMDDDPTGDPALATAYKPWYRKEGDLKNQGASSRQSGGGSLVGTEAYPPQGTPYVATVPVRNPSTGEIKDEPKALVAAQELAKLQTGRAAKLPVGMDAKFLQTNGSAVFDSALDRSDREMVMCFLGQARAILSSDSNSQADSGVAEGIALTMRDVYRGRLCAAIEGMFKTFILLNLGPEYADVIPKYDIFTEETKDLAAVGNFLAGNFDRLTLDQKNVLASWVGLPDFPEEEDETAVIDKEERARAEAEVAQIQAEDQGAEFKDTRLDIANRASQKRIDGYVRSANRQFGSLVKRLANGRLSADEFRDRFAYTLSVVHERAYREGFRHGGGGDELTVEGEEYIATVQATESDYMLGLAEALESGEISEAEAMRRANLYAKRPRGTANAAFRQASVGTGETITWELAGVEDHCSECPTYASMSPWEPDELFAVPGDGETPCKSNCLCHLVRSDGKKGYGPTSFS